MSNRNENLVSFFNAYEGKDEPFFTIGEEFKDLVETIFENVEEDSPELTVALRKLLESLDCVNRALILQGD